ncbi:MAG TPA: amino acid ABC transporter substrate-binding protein [Actinomycetota bacterium]|nr:amino acid ABC transporter substrate-binding protein [Actinomycetota bacterium]
MARGRWKVAAALTAMVLVVAGCGGDDDQGGAQSKEPIVIGASLPLTGDFSQPGGAAKNGYEIWRDMVNQQGGLLGRQVQLTILDDASDQNTVVADYNRLITRDKVDLLLGTFSSLLNLPASAVAERNRMVYVEPAGGAPAMFERKFHYLFFAQQATAPHQADVFVDWINSLPADQRPKTAAYPTQDDPFARPVIDTMQKALEQAGVRTVYSTVYPPETTNFDTIANAVKARNPDLLAQGAVFEDGVGLVRSLLKVGFSPKMLFQTSAPSNSDQYAEGIGEANTEGVFYTVSWSPEATYPLNKEFVQRYQQKFNRIPEEDAADAFAAAQVLQAAVAAVGEIDQGKLADWLHANQVDTILGPLRWDATGAPQSDFLLAQWQNGQSEIVLPQNVATTDSVVNPKPDWKSS